LKKLKIYDHLTGKVGEHLLAIPPRSRLLQNSGHCTSEITTPTGLDLWKGSWFDKFGINVIAGENLTLRFSMETRSLSRTFIINRWSSRC